MNPNPIDNDLQKAIEDITNNTNNDPVFDEPVAAPEPAPAPAPMPPRPMGPLPEVGMPPVPTVPEAPEPIEPEPLPEPEAEPAQKPIMDFRPNPSNHVSRPTPVQDITPPKPDPIAEAISEQEAEIEEEEHEPESRPVSGEFHEVKESILRDLAPMVDKIDMDPSKKFDLYKDIHEELHDDSVIASAYEVSKKIDDDEKRADALLYLYDSLK